MTIYAIVNDIIGSEERSAPLWTLISPSGILQGGNPYFVPDFAERFEARTAMAIRIGKLGKGIAPRFADRYVDAAAPAIVFVAADMLQRLRSDGLPWTSAMSYDRCLAIGKFKPVKSGDIPHTECSMTIEGGDPTAKPKTYCFRAGLRLEGILTAISRDNTLKTGDTLLVGLQASGPEVAPGMKVRLGINGEPSLAFNIR